MGFTVEKSQGRDGLGMTSNGEFIRRDIFSQMQDLDLYRDAINELYTRYGIDPYDNLPLDELPVELASDIKLLNSKWASLKPKQMVELGITGEDVGDNYGMDSGHKYEQKTEDVSSADWNRKIENPDFDSSLPESDDNPKMIDNPEEYYESSDTVYKTDRDGNFLDENGNVIDPSGGYVSPKDRVVEKYTTDRDTHKIKTRGYTGDIHNKYGRYAESTPDKKGRTHKYKVETSDSDIHPYSGGGEVLGKGTDVVTGTREGKHGFGSHRKVWKDEKSGKYYTTLQFKGPKGVHKNPVLSKPREISQRRYDKIVKRLNKKQLRMIAKN